MHRGSQRNDRIDHSLLRRRLSFSLSPRAGVAGRALLEEVHGTRKRTFIIISLCSDDGDTIPDCNGPTEIIIRCSVGGGEFRHLRPRARRRALLEEVRGTRTRTFIVVTVCSDDDGTIADCNGTTELICFAPSSAVSFATCANGLASPEELFSKVENQNPEPS